jgi:small subunit ribosomal protein S19
MAKEFIYRGKTLEQLQQMPMEELADLLPSSARRKIVKKGFTDAEKIFLKDVAANESGIKTHCRDMLVLPMMVGKRIKIHNGKEWNEMMITGPMIGHRLGEFSQPRKHLKHGAIGVTQELKH